MELTTAEEVHVVCLFPDLNRAAAFGALVRSTLPPVENRPDFFGHQLVMDGEDHILREETALLAGASGIGIYQTAGLVKQYGGVAYPAHIDRDSVSVLSNLGLWDPELGFSLAELSRRCPPELKRRPDLAGLRFITGCDAHYLDQIPDASQAMVLEDLSPGAVLSWLNF